MLSTLVARSLIVRSEPLQAEVIVVLSGSSVYEERLRHAARLFREGRARAIVLTDDGQRGRWSRQRQRNLRPVEHGRDMLLASGVRMEDLVVLPKPIHSTHDEAVAVQMYARARQIRSVLVVTSPYHARRSFWVFNRVLAADAVSVGIDPVPTGDQSPAPWKWWLSWRGWQSVGAEYPKLAYYLVAYR